MTSASSVVTCVVARVSSPKIAAHATMILPPAETVRQQRYRVVAERESRGLRCEHRTHRGNRHLQIASDEGGEIRQQIGVVSVDRHDQRASPEQHPAVLPQPHGVQNGVD